eukprot:TRINITY_DN22200_c0_g2_i2.p1 TRINITY_DN22200_c0_g2~~TRINITY_DN22200_c0_g2_i2.p1  ORF type:complete len:314 (+),score=60.73 TRINITY_DN22200_c0_g2_i2:15-956(+)
MQQWMYMWRATFSRLISHTEKLRLPEMRDTVLMCARRGVFLAALPAAAAAVAYRELPASCEEGRLKRWQERWAAHQTSFHLESVNPILQKFLSEMIPASTPAAANGMGTRVLIPLCGKTIDMVFLSRQGYRVVGVEGVGQAIEEFAREQGIPIPTAKGPTMHVHLPPEVDPLRFRAHAALIGAGDEQTRTEPPPPVILIEALVPFDAAFDRGGIVAVDPKDRKRYAEVLSHLMAPGGRLLLVAVEHDAFSDGRLGPPFEVTEADVRTLFSSNFEIKLLRREDRIDKDAGMRSRGVTRFHECAYLLTRRSAPSE